MKYYKYLDLDWQPAAIKLKEYILTVNRAILANPKSTSWKPTDLGEVLAYAPELIDMVKPLNITIRYLAFFVSDYKQGTLHIDADLYSKCRINIPILNCENTETRFFETTADPIKTLQPNGVPLYNLDPSKCKQVDQLYLTQAVVFRNNAPHQVVSSNPNLPRISCTMGFNEDIEYLLE